MRVGARYRQRWWSRPGSGFGAFSAGRGRCTGAASGRRRRWCRPARCRCRTCPGSARINSSAQASLQASQHLLVAWRPGCPSAGFPAMVPLNSTFFCSTMATLLRRVSRSYSRTSTPPTQHAALGRRRTDAGSAAPGWTWREPVPPMMPMVSPDLMSQVNVARAPSRRFFYRQKLTWSNLTEPSLTSMTGFSRVGQVGLLVQHLGHALGGGCGHRDHDETPWTASSGSSGCSCSSSACSSGRPVVKVVAPELTMSWAPIQEMSRMQL